MKDVALPASGERPRSTLILGATGYVGGRLVPQLLAAGHRVRCLARTPAKLDGRPWRSDIEVVKGDLLEPETLAPAFDGVDVVYYLVHSLGTGEGFEERERRSARNAADAAAAAGVAQIVYLGGLGEKHDDLSPHLCSRHAVGEELADGPTPVTELRAAVILGSGSASFEMLRGLTEVLPAMITPRWVSSTKCQPIAIGDVLDSLIGVLGRDDTIGVWEIGGTDVVSYGEMMQAYAEVAGLRKRLIIPVPVLTPRLSSRWVTFVTSLPATLSTELVESLQNDVIVGDRPLQRVLPLDVSGLRDALGAALSAVQDLDVPTSWVRPTPDAAALPRPWDPDWAGGTVLEDIRQVTIDAEPRDVMAEVSALGGRDGWLGYDFLWDLRGLGDAIIGGVGIRRSRRHPTDLNVGDLVDLFRVEEVSPTSLRLRAEMKLPGYGWLGWRVEPGDGAATELTQKVRFVPRGLAGRLYWAVLVPFHSLIFGRMLAELRRRAEDRATERRASEGYPHHERAPARTLTEGTGPRG